MKTKYKCLYEITGCIEDVATFLVPIADLPKQEHGEPLDMPLPCDVKVGHVNIRKGVALKTLVARMKVLYDMAQSKQEYRKPVAALFEDGSIVKMADLEFVPEKSGQRVQMLVIASQTTQQNQPDLDAICQDLQEKTYTQAMRIAELEEALAKQEQSVSVGEPVAHCEAGKDYCQKCRDENVNTPLDAAVRYIQNNTPKLVSQEICEALNHVPDAEKMVDALQEIGDFAHDKSTGPAVPDALWEIRSMAYNALVEQRLSNGCTHQQPAQPKEPLTYVLLHLFQEWKEDHLSDSNYIDAVEQIKAVHGIKE